MFATLIDLDEMQLGRGIEQRGGPLQGRRVKQAQAGRLSDTAALFQAMGGGWWNRSTPIADAGGRIAAN